MNKFHIISLFLLQSIFNPSIAQNIADSSKKELFQLSLEELLDIKVRSASKFDESIKEIPYSTYIITRKDIDIYGYRSLAEALQHVPGFYMFDDHTMYKENFGVRGFHRDEWNQDIVFLVNGIRQRSDYDYNNKLSYINVPIQSIERIEVIKGPASVTYGNGAFFGVVNIITTNNEKPKSNVYTVGGSQSTYGAGINYRAAIEDFNLTINTGYKITKGIEQNYEDISGDTSLSTQGFMNENQKYFSFYLEKNGLYAGASFDKNNSNRPSISAPYISKNYEANSDFTANRYVLGINKQLNDRLLINASYEYQFQEEALFFDFAGLDNDQEYQNSKIESSQIDFNIKYHLNSKFDFSIGGSFLMVSDYYDVIDVPQVALVNVHKSLDSPMINWGTYARIKYRISKKLSLQAGLRIDELISYTVTTKEYLGTQYDGSQNNFVEEKNNYPDFGLAYIPEFSFFYSINNKHQLKFIYGEAINRPSIFRVQQASEGNMPEYISSLELNYTAVLGSKFKLNTSLIYNYLHNLVNIEFLIENGDQTQKTNNSGVYSTLGFETEIEYRITNKFRVSTSVNLYKTKNHKYSEYPAFSPKLLAGLNLSYQLQEFTFALTNVYVGSMESTFDYQLQEPNNPNSSAIGRIGNASPAYLNTGLNVRWRPSFLEGLFCNLRISNLLDQKMYYPVGDYNPWATKGTLGISRTYLFTLGYEF